MFDVLLKCTHFAFHSFTRLLFTHPLCLDLLLAADIPFVACLAESLISLCLYEKLYRKLSDYKFVLLLIRLIGHLKSS